MNEARVILAVAVLPTVFFCCGSGGALPAGRPDVSTVTERLQNNRIDMQVGETRIFRHPGLKRIAVGNGLVLKASVVEIRDVIVFARQPGESSLHVWAGSETAMAYDIRVSPVGARDMREALLSFLSKISGVHSALVGKNIIVQGDDLSDADRASIATLAERYAEIINLTSKVGWDRMILLDVQVIELPRAKMRELGVRWDAASAGGWSAGAAWDSASIGRLRERPGEAPLEVPGRFAPLAGFFSLNAMLSAKINAMTQSGDAVVLAQPQLLTRSGTTAEFLAGGEVPYVTTDTNGKATTLFKSYGVALKITPHAQAGGNIRSRVEIEASAVDSTLGTKSGPALKTRRASTEFNARSGQTLVLAGFLSREQTDSVQGVPGLSRLPLVGALFRSNRSESRQTELAIFVTPVVVAPGHADIDERVRRGRAVIDAAFDEPARINVPVHPGPANPSWNDFSGSGSQWKSSND